MSKNVSKNGDLFIERELDPEELAGFGLEAQVRFKGRLMASDVLLRDRVKTIRVREEPNGRTYSIWFKEGGTVELVVNDQDEVELIDSYGCDFSFTWNNIEFHSHKADPDSPRYRGADPNYKGPANSGEMFTKAFQQLSVDETSSDDETRH